MPEFKKANSLTTISHYVEKEVKKKSPNLKFEIITPGVEFDYFVEKKSNIKIEKEKPYVLSVAKLKPRKGHHISLPAFKKVSETIKVERINISERGVRNIILNPINMGRPRGSKNKNTLARKL